MKAGRSGLRRGRHDPATWIAVGITVILVLLGFGYGVLRWLVLERTATSFAAKVTTTAIAFTSAGERADGENGGLFAPSQKLDVTVEGCKRMVPVGRPGTAAVDCPKSGLRLQGVRFDSVTLPPGTEVMLAVEDGRLHLQLRPPAEKVDQMDLVIQARPGAGAVLAEGSWRTQLANVGVDLFVTQKTAHALPDESKLALLDGTGVSFENDGESALLGEGNELVVARSKDHVSLKEGRLAVRGLEAGRIRRLSVDWEGGAFKAMHALVTGRSRAILVSSVYTDEASNEALNRLDTFAQGRSTRSVATVAGTLGLSTLVTVLASFAVAIYSARTLEN